MIWSGIYSVWYFSSFPRSICCIIQCGINVGLLKGVSLSRCEVMCSTYVYVKIAKVENVCGLFRCIIQNVLDKVVRYRIRKKMGIKMKKKSCINENWSTSDWISSYTDIFHCILITYNYKFTTKMKRKNIQIFNIVFFFFFLCFQVLESIKMWAKKKQNANAQQGAASSWVVFKTSHRCIVSILNLNTYYNN